MVSRKEERLSGKKTISELFQSGDSIVVAPIRLIFAEKNLSTLQYPVQILISVPKKTIPGAVQRNRIKRQIREAFRKNKNIIYNFLYKRNKQYVMSVIYTSAKKITYKEIEQKLIIALQLVIKKHEKDS